jgi:hypothetical protein
MGGMVRRPISMAEQLDGEDAKLVTLGDRRA